MVTRISTILIIGAVAVCLPVATWTFVLQPSRFGSSTIAGQHQHQQQPPLALDALLSKTTKTHPQRVAFCPLLAKKEEDEEDIEGWEPDEDELLEDEDIDIEDLDDELDLDDVESSVAGTNPDEYEDDDIDYEDEEIEEEGEEELEEEEEETDEVMEEDVEDVEEEEDDVDPNLDPNAKYVEGYSKWWEDYGYESREAFDNGKLFPGGIEAIFAVEKPDDDFWDDEVTMVPLAEDPDNPEFNAKLKELMASSKKRKALVEAQEAQVDLTKMVFDDEDPTNELEVIDEMSELLDQAIPGGLNGEEEVTLDATDLEDMDIREEMLASTNLIDDEPYIGANRTNIAGTGLTDEDMEALDKSWNRLNENIESEPWNKVAELKTDHDSDAFPKQYYYDMHQTAEEIGSAGYDVYPWLKYDMGFNVSNLVLAAVKHNRDAPLILQHWYPQLMVCERYQDARDRDFDFTWEDVEKADIKELEDYYMGFGYDEIPKKMPSQTGLISFEDTDEQETKMAAMEKWMLDIYNAEWDKKDFDDENIKDEDNVFSDNFKMPAHPDLPAWDDVQEDIGKWRDEWDEDKEDEDEETRKKNIAYRNTMGESIDFTSVQDDEFQKDFRGHLVVACGNYDEDLEVAEKITERMEKEFGNVIYTETKIYKHAMPDDNLFEIWLESYEIDLLHSKRRAFMGVDGWEGKGEITDERMDFLVKEISDLTSEDARLSFRWTEEQVQG